MAEIGASLREARMRAKLDITEVEADTKIRGKYLRALENEEWALLPGPTFVRSFLRTYGDYLGLDGRMLVEEFKLRYEGYDDRDVPPLRAPRNAARDRAARDRARRQGTSGRAAPNDGRGRLLLVAGLLALLVAGLFVLGQCGKNDKKPSPRPVSPSATKTAPAPAATLRIVPRGRVYVCLRGADGSRLIDGQTVSASAAARSYRASRMQLTLGAPGATLILDGVSHTIASSKRAHGFAITPGSLKPVPASARVICP